MTFGQRLIFTIIFTAFWLITFFCINWLLDVQLSNESYYRYVGGFAMGFYIALYYFNSKEK